MLELEKLTDEVAKMAEGAYLQRQESDAVLRELLRKLHENATAWERVERALKEAMASVDLKWYRGARPLDRREPLDAVVDPPPPPPVATLVASDGSQILPNRHGAYLYSVINVGIIVYHHGSGRAPEQSTRPLLDYPNGEDEDTFVDNGAIVNLRRDRAEIEALVEVALNYGGQPQPVLALLDQRLLYWPVGPSGPDEGQRVLHAWQQAMSHAHQGNCLLAGYIDRPGKRSVVTMLDTLEIGEPGFDMESLLHYSAGPGITDAVLFRRLLGPGQRSKVFVDISQHNIEFTSRDGQNEVCFFYLNPGRSGRQIARVDIPMSVAREPEQVELVHGLIYNQCSIMGDYPYVLARADELAVVGYQDRTNLEIMIAGAMERHGLAGNVTAKRSSKTVARGSRTRHGM